MSTPDPVDVVVVGAGASGAIVSLVLAQAGIRVVCLEQGGWTRGQAYPHQSPDWEWRRHTDWATEPNLRRAAADYPVETEDERTLMFNGVGGSTVIYTALWPRLRPSDFRKGTEHGLAPDWPMTYEDLAPYYDRTDLMLGTSGLVGDPGMPPRGPFATPPLSPGRSTPAIARTFDRLGWHWWPFPGGVISESFDGRPGCNHCGNCVSGCPRGALADVSYSIWPKALAAGCELRTGAAACRIETDAQGFASGVVYRDRNTGRTVRQRAEIVVLAANGVGTPRLLLLSATGRSPAGLANGSDQVGRGLMHHTLIGAEYWVDEPLDSHMGYVGALISSQFAETDTSRGFVNGFNFNVSRTAAPGSHAAGLFSGRSAPWGRGHHAWFRRRFSRSFRAYAIGDDLPQPDNRVTLSARLQDSDGIPAPRVSYRPHANDVAQMRWAIDRLHEIAAAAGAHDHAVNDYGLGAGHYRTPAWHLLGTCRMGADPAASVIDADHRAHDVPNLLIVDGSAMPTGGVVNPTSTICALALRAAERLRDSRSRSRPVAA